MTKGNILQRSFSGVNAGRGFVSFYDRIFEEDKFAALYIIKGGPGTGKSTFMKRLRVIATDKGYTCSEYLCGSDEESLDGLIIRRKDGKAVGILDGTPPHARELQFPGAAGDILNFGEFWDSMGLRKRHQEIDRIVKEKTSLFETAYRYLSAAEKINRQIEKMSRNIYLKNKGYAAAVRLADSLGEAGRCDNIQLSGFTMNGNVRLLPCEYGIRQYRVAGDCDTGALFLSDMAEYIKTKKICAMIDYSPLDLTTVLGIFFPESKVWISIGTDADNGTNAEKVINVRRFTDKEKYAESRQKLRFGKKCRAALLDGAREALSNAKILHFELEEIYKEYMDFGALSKQSEEWYSEILSVLD